MPKNKTPDVYVEELPSSLRAVTDVDTSLAAFVGYTEKAKKKWAGVLCHVPTKITSMAEYSRYFGGPHVESLTIDLIEDPIQNTIQRFFCSKMAGRGFRR